MACNISDVKKDALTEAKYVFKDNAKSVTFKGDVAYIHYGPGYQVKNRNGAREMAKKKMAKVSEAMEARFESSKYKNGWTKLDESLVDGLNKKILRVYFTFPNNLERAYKIKNNQEITEQDRLDAITVQSEDAERAGEEFTDDYLFQIDSGEIPKEGPIKDLNDLLEKHLKNYGVTTDRVGELQQVKGVDLIGVADMFSKMISIVEGKEKIDTLPEEASHFFFELMNGTTLQTRILNLLKKDNYYKELLGDEFDSYNSLYNGDITKLAKEAAGKVLSESIIRNYQNPNVTTPTKNLLQRAWEYITKLFKTNIAKTELQQEIYDIFDQLGIDILEGKDVGFKKFEKKPVKEGVSELFKDNPELSTIGNKEQYSEYLDSIFPDSRVNEIVYHGTKGEKFDKFKPSEKGEFGKGVYFGNYQTALENTDITDDFTLEPVTGFDKNKIITAVINTQSIQERDLGDNGIRNEYVVAPEQIHILGSKQDIEGFKDWINTKKEESSFYQTDNIKKTKKKLKGHEKVANDIKVATARRLRTLELKKDNKELSKEETKRADKILQLYDEALYVEGNARYIGNLVDDMEQIQNAITKLSDLSEENYIEDIRSTSQLLRRAKEYYDTNIPILSDLQVTIRQEIKSTDNNGLKESNEAILANVKELKDAFDVMIKEYYIAGNNLVGFTVKDLLGDRNNERLIGELNERLPAKRRLSTVDLNTLFTETSKDIGMVSRFIDALAETDDTALQLVDLMVKKANYESRQTTTDNTQDMMDAQRKYGDSDTSFVMAKNSKGKFSGTMVVERDWVSMDEAFLEIRDSESKQVKELAKKHPKDSDAYNKELTKIKAKTKSKLAAVYKTQALDYKDSQALVAQKREELSKKEFKKWLYFNAKVDDTNINPKSGNIEPLYTIPKNKSKQYQAIQSNTKKKAYYDTVMNMKYQKDMLLPEKLRSGRLAPQIRENTLDRFKNIKSGEDMKALWDQVKETVSVMADEDERGVRYELAGADGEEIRFLPVYYTRRIKNPETVSTDFTMSMSVYAGMANNYAEMSKIVDTLEITKDLVDNRDIIQRDSSGNILMESLNLLGEKIKKPVKTRDSKGSNVSERLNSYYDMMVYGRLKKDEGKILGVDVAKVADTLGAYTAMNQLSLNLLAGSANILNGKAMERIDAIAGEYFEYKDLLYADKTYYKELPKLLEQIGKYDEGKSKLQLWMKYKDVLQDFNSNLKGLDSNRKTRFGRLFNTSSLMFVQGSGEHYLQSRTSLALSNQLRWNGKEFVWKKDYYKAVLDLKYEMRTKLQEKNSNSKEITKEYKEKIKLETEKLDKSWKKLTNYYDAHEVKGNKLVLKSEFKEQKDTDFKFVNKQNFLNKRMHGIYNDIDKNVLQQYSLGRLGLLFRKWMVPAYNRRWKGMMFNYEGDNFTEGYYNTFFRILYQDIKEKQFSYIKNWNKLTELEQANFKRATTELVHLFLYTIAAAIFTGALDDDDSWALNMIAYNANRMKTELGTVTPTPWALQEGLRIIQSPTAATQPLQELLNFMEFWQWSDELESGKYKGWTRFEKHGFRLLPGTKPIHNVLFPEEQMKFYTK